MANLSTAGCVPKPDGEGTIKIRNHTEFMQNDQGTSIIYIHLTETYSGNDFLK